MLIWYLARGAGLAGYAALSVATGAGALAARRGGRVERRVIVQYVHRAAALCGVALLLAHVSFLLLDSYAHVGWLGALVPFQSGYRAWQVTLGLLSLYLLVLVSVTGVLRSRLASSERASRWWRRVHLASYAAWAMSALHFLVTGTDSGTAWARIVLVAGAGIVATGVIARLSDRPALMGRPQAPVARFGADAPGTVPIHATAVGAGR